MKKFYDEIEEEYGIRYRGGMTWSSAKFIVGLRLKGYTFRAICRDVAKRYPNFKLNTHNDGGGFQMDGQFIYCMALKFFIDNDAYPDTFITKHFIFDISPKIKERKLKENIK